MAAGRFTTGNHVRLLQLGLDKIIDDERARYTGVHKKIFKEVTVDKSFYESYRMSGLSPATLRTEGAGLAFEASGKAWTQKVPLYVYEKNLRFTMECLDDNQYLNLLKYFGPIAARTHEERKDMIASDIFNNAFSSSFLGPDGKALCATDHPLESGDTGANKESTDVSLSEEAVEAGVRKIWAFKQESGSVGNFDPMYLVVPPSLYHEALRITRSPQRPGVADNDINAIKADGNIKEVICWKRLEDTDGWFITTNANALGVDSLIVGNKKGVTSRTKDAPDNYDTIYSSFSRFTVFFSDWRGVYGSDGS